MDNYDVVIIGAGPGGYVAAIRAAHHGLKAAIIERDPQLGGTCLLRGCIPTKSLLHAADLMQSLRHAKQAGFFTGDISFDFAAVQRARDKQVQKGASGVAWLMQQNKVTVVTGHGALAGEGRVRVTHHGQDTVLAAKHVVLATGSRPRRIPSITIDGKHFVTSDEILQLSQPPASLIILGAGAVGCEFASVYSRFGTACTIVEMQNNLVPVEDHEVSQEFTKLLKKRGIASFVGTAFEKAEVHDDMVHATLRQGDKTFVHKAQMVLVAVGRAPVSDDIGLQTVDIKRDAGGYIEVNAMMQTRAKNVYAIGDVVRTPWLAHVASAEALLAADHIAHGQARPLNYNQVPGCTYTDPEIASVGLTERAARAQGYDVKIGKFPFAAVAKARILGATEGFIKIVAEARYGEILGVHIIGPHATDLIAEACVALKLECTAEELAHTIHAHPTLAEGVLEAAHAALGRPLHL